MHSKHAREDGESQRIIEVYWRRTQAATASAQVAGAAEGILESTYLYVSRKKRHKRQLTHLCSTRRLA